MKIMTSHRTRLFHRLLSAFIAFTFSFTSVVPPSYAQSLASLNLPVPGAMVGPSQTFVPVLLKGMTIHPENPLQFDFIVDTGNSGLDGGNGRDHSLRAESEKLVKYFLASMTIPKDDLWVNLSPYEKDRIIPDELGKTELGRDMLAQDYILKQLTASLMYPEKELGKEFWDKVYQKAKEKFGTTEIPVDTFNKVWILPETATVYEHGQTVYIVEAKLRVMLDSDYLAQSHQGTTSQGHQKAVTGDVVTATEGSPQQGSDPVTTQIVREVILPEIEREVNEGQNFASLRQIYHSLILAKWYKETIKNSLLSKIYIDQKKIAGVNLDDATLKDQIYSQYMEAYKKGVFNYIKEDYDRLSNEMIPRKYFSGGIKGDVEIGRTSSQRGIASSAVGKNFQLAMRIDPQKKNKSSSPVEENNGKRDPSGTPLAKALIFGGGHGTLWYTDALKDSFDITRVISPFDGGVFFDNESGKLLSSIWDRPSSSGAMRFYVKGFPALGDITKVIVEHSPEKYIQDFMNARFTAWYTQFPDEAKKDLKLSEGGFTNLVDVIEDLIDRYKAKLKDEHNDPSADLAFRDFTGNILIKYARIIDNSAGFNLFDKSFTETEAEKHIVNQGSYISHYRHSLKNLILYAMYLEQEKSSPSKNPKTREANWKNAIEEFAKLVGLRGEKLSKTLSQTLLSANYIGNVEPVAKLDGETYLYGQEEITQHIFLSAGQANLISDKSIQDIFLQREQISRLRSIPVIEKK
ncbi:MAG: hypothetical protein HZA28_07575 [Candidatus Omnitrophica bacterium]|nr:hypothetical protein [Candidatus Omnitrophota bacterium]